jgi:hypothetical protein
MKAVSIEWAKLSVEQKRYYIEESKAEKRKYEAAMVEWQREKN